MRYRRYACIQRCDAGMIGRRMIISIFERRAIVAGLVLAAIIVALFSNILFTGRILSASDLIFTSPFFAQAAPTGYTHPANAYLSDQVYQLSLGVIWHGTRCARDVSR